jgi:NTP pyrophosphatase (non-canonical NTP hydrolase)
MVATGHGDFAIGSRTWPGLSKLVEELGEVAQVAGKLIATGGEPDHWDGTNLRTRLEDELADLEAAIAFVLEHNDLDAGRVAERRAAKLRQFGDWHREQGGGAAGAAY